jgi:hypothetical protein
MHNILDIQRFQGASYHGPMSKAGALRGAAISAISLWLKPVFYGIFNS